MSTPTSLSVDMAHHPFNTLSPSAFLSQNPPIQSLLASAIVIDPHTQKVLLLRRSATDSWALKWEIPGGCVESGDVSLVAAAVRELSEETGLKATRVHRAVALPEGWKREEEKAYVRDGVCVFVESDGVWGKITVLVDVEHVGHVEVRDDEHEEWAWVSEDEVKREVLGDGRELDFVSWSVKETVLEGFRAWREVREKEK